MVLLRLPQTRRAVVFSIHTYMVRPEALTPGAALQSRGAAPRGAGKVCGARVFALTGPGTRASAGSERAGPSGPTPFARMTKSGYLTVTASSAATSAAGATTGASATGSGLGSPLAAVCVQPGDVPGAVRRAFWPAAGWLYAAQSLETVGTVLPASGRLGVSTCAAAGGASVSAAGAPRPRALVSKAAAGWRAGSERPAARQSAIGRQKAGMGIPPILPVFSVEEARRNRRNRFASLRYLPIMCAGTAPADTASRRCCTQLLCLRRSAALFAARRSQVGLRRKIMTQGIGL